METDCDRGEGKDLWSWMGGIGGSKECMTLLGSLLTTSGILPEGIRKKVREQEWIPFPFFALTVVHFPRENRVFVVHVSPVIWFFFCLLRSRGNVLFLLVFVGFVTLICLLLIVKARAKYRTYVRVSVL